MSFKAYSVLLISLLFLSSSVFSLSKFQSPQLKLLSEEKVEAKLQHVFEKYFFDEDDSEFLAIADQLKMPDLISKFGTKSQQSSFGIGSAITCSLCRTFAKVFLSASKVISRNALANILTDTCKTLKLSSETVCSGLIDENIDILLYIIKNSDHLSGKFICSVVLQGKDCAAEDDRDWTIELDDGYSKKLEETFSNNSIKVLQISDLHYDALYLPGANAVCDNPICCGDDSGPLADESDAAGYWGDFRECDTPWHTIVNSFENVVKTFDDISVVYFTGDIISHRIWMTSQSDNAKYLVQGYNLIDQYFSKSKIFPIFGNHEPSPLNLYPPEDVAEEFKQDWLFELAAKEWTNKWLPQSTYETIRKGGFYTVKVNDKFRVIALNSNVCYILNFWLFYNNVDIYGQLAWLRDTLAEAEINGESVHILSHIPTGSNSCYRVWAREYRRIINRYANNVKAIFNGHTHYNEFELFYNTSDSSKAIAMAFNGGSITPYDKVNVNYVVYEADKNTMAITDSSTYIYNLTEANEAGPQVDPNWYKLYSFKDAYGIKDLSLTSLNKLMIKLASNKTLAKLYYRNKYKNSDPFLKEDCDDDCLIEELCSAVSSLSGDKTQCDILTELWKSASN